MNKADEHRKPCFPARTRTFKRRATQITTLAWLLISGCVSNRDWTAVGEPSDYEFAAQKGGVTVALETWSRPEDTKAAFGKDLLAHNVLAIQVIVFNRGDSRIRFSSTQAKLCLANGIELPVFPISEVSHLIDENESAAAVIITIATGGYGAGIASAVSHAVEKNNWKTQSNVRRMGMELVSLNSQEAMTGFLFFDYEPCQEQLKHKNTNWQLTLTRLPRDRGPPLQFSIPFHLEKKESSR